LLSFQAFPNGQPAALSSDAGIRTQCSEQENNNVLHQRVTGNSLIMTRFPEGSSSRRENGAATLPHLNTWIVLTLILIVLIAVFRMEFHLRKVEHRPFSQVWHFSVAKASMSWNEDGELG